jgi:hypothetical protein
MWEISFEDNGGYKDAGHEDGFIRHCVWQVPQARAGGRKGMHIL